MSETNQASIVIFAMLYPDKLERCLATLHASKNVKLDVKVLLPAGMKEKKEELRALLGEGNVRVIKGDNAEGISGQFRELMKSCRYDNLFMVPADSVFESFTCSKACEHQKTADCTIFNVGVLSPILMGSSILYSRTVPALDLLRQDARKEDSLSLACVYQQSPNIWNQVYSRSKLLESGLILKDITRSSQLLFQSAYHAQCTSIILDPSIFLYRNGLAGKETPPTGFCIKHQKEISGMLRSAKKTLPEDALEVLHKDFALTAVDVLQFSTGRVKTALFRKQGGKDE